MSSVQSNMYPRLIDICDDAPFWSAPFGLVLLDRVRVRPVMAVVDVGTGTGFPLVELAQRLGSKCRVVGVDPSPDALARAQSKLDVWGVSHVELIVARAENLPLDTASVDLVISNNGLNNVDDLPTALSECARICKVGAQLVFTFNLPGTFIEFYSVLEQVLEVRGLVAELERMRRHIFTLRKSVEYMRHAVSAAGFTTIDVVESQWRYRFASAEALFDHGFFRVAFIPAWNALFSDVQQRSEVFNVAKLALEQTVQSQGELAMSVPFACFDCRR